MLTLSSLRLMTRLTIMAEYKCACDSQYIAEREYMNVEAKHIYLYLSSWRNCEAICPSAGPIMGRNGR